MAYTKRMVEGLGREVRYEDVRCNNCQALLEPVERGEEDEYGWKYLQANEALHVQFTGGYGEFVDQMSEQDIEDCAAILCVDCARKLADAFPFIKDLLFRHMNLNVGHVCNGEQVWVPQPECTVDPDQHGWRRVWVVTPEKNTAVRGLMSHLVADSQEEADAFIAQHPGRGLTVHCTPVANVNVYRIAPVV